MIRIAPTSLLERFFSWCRPLPPGRALAFCLALYAAGASHWLVFLDFGNIPFGLADWRQEYQYGSVLKSAMDSGRLPLRISSATRGTDSFLAIPEVPQVPYVLLLKWLPLKAYLLLHLLLFYTAGFAGCLAFARTYSLSPGAFSLLFLLFNFNGYVTSHLAVGHLALVTGYFLLPFFFLLALKWLEEGPSPSRAAAMALVLFAISLPGSFHTVIWCSLFLLLLGLGRPMWFKHLVITASLGAGLTAYRLLPGVLAYRDGGLGSPFGFPKLSILPAAFASLKTYRIPPPNVVRWWEARWWEFSWFEFDMYVGILGSVALVGLGLLPLIIRVRGIPARPNHRLMLLPVCALVALAYGNFYFLFFSEIPPFSAERTVTRLLVLPLVLLTLLACRNFSSLQQKLGTSLRASTASAAGLTLVAVELLRHSWAWRIEALAAVVPQAYAPPADILALVATLASPHALAFAVGWLVTAAAVVLGIWLVRRGKPWLISIPAVLKSSSRSRRRR